MVGSAGRSIGANDVAVGFCLTASVVFDSTGTATDAFGGAAAEQLVSARMATPAAASQAMPSAGSVAEKPDDETLSDGFP